MSSYNEFKKDAGMFIIGMLLALIITAAISLTFLAISIFTTALILLIARAIRGEDKEADDNIKYYAFVITWGILVFGFFSRFMYVWVMAVNGVRIDFIP
jgi:dolichol kinase